MLSVLLHIQCLCVHRAIKVLQFDCDYIYENSVIILLISAVSS